MRNCFVSQSLSHGSNQPIPCCFLGRVVLVMGSFCGLHLQNFRFLKFALSVVERLVHGGLEAFGTEKVSVISLKEMHVIKLLLRANG